MNVSQTLLWESVYDTEELVRRRALAPGIIFLEALSVPSIISLSPPNDSWWNWQLLENKQNLSHHALKGFLRHCLDIVIFFIR